ncbi:MAG TPA: hypothetical protein VFL41_07745 [Gaiellaceae bacterium]|nr:hypothetical protein [Gaiellaceae bacterium]
MRAAPIALAGYFFLVAVVAGIAAVAQVRDDSDDYSRGVSILITVDWLVSGAIFALAGVLLARRREGVDRRTVLILAAICVLDAVLLTFAPLLGAPIAALVSLGAIVRWTAEPRSAP